MLIKIVFALVAVIAILAAVISMQPADFRISRSITVAAAPAVVFAQVNDFHKWEAWSPWAKLDSTMKTSFDGPASGEGASYSWSGDDKAGEGKMLITKSRPPELVLINLEFTRPMSATNLTEFTFKPQDQGTLVTWTMSGTNNFAAKAFHLVMDMEKLLGPDFEKGLAAMKVAAETAPR